IEGANPTEQRYLNEFRHRETGGDYKAGPNKTGDTGAYSFQDASWKEAAEATGQGKEFAHAKDAPPAVQDANALWFYRKYGPGPWKATGPYPGDQAAGGGVDRLTPYAKGNAVAGGPSPITGVHPEFANRVADMVEAMPDDIRNRFSIVSGYRSAARQAV